MGKRGRSKLSNAQVKERKKLAEETAQAVRRAVLTQPPEAELGTLPLLGCLSVGGAYVAPMIMYANGIDKELAADADLRASFGQWLMSEMLDFFDRTDLTAYRESSFYDPKIDGIEREEANAVAGGADGAEG